MPHAAGLWYEWHGPEDAQILILSPGLGGSAGYWQPNLSVFAERYRVLLYDHRGTGRSERALPDAVTIEDMAGDVAGLMDALGVGRVHFIGHALGGLIGLALARSAAGRLDRLVVVNGWAQLDPYTARCFDVRLELLRSGGPRAYLRAQPIFLYPPDWISVHSARLDEEAEAQLRHFPKPETVEKRIAAVRAWNPGESLRAIRTPVLVLATANDALVPAHAARDLCDLLPNHSRMLQFSGGHASNVTESEDFYDRVLPWLAGEEQSKE